MTQRLSTLLLLMVLAVPARAWTYGDTLTVVWKPLPTLPAIVRPTDTLAVWANAPSSATGWSASLRFGALTVPLAPAGGGFVASKSRWELGFVIPVGTPEEIYDLQLASDATAGRLRPLGKRRAARLLADHDDRSLGCDGPRPRASRTDISLAQEPRMEEVPGAPAADG